MSLAGFLFLGDGFFYRDTINTTKTTANHGVEWLGDGVVPIKPLLKGGHIALK